jgi:hypothetical protein
MATLPERVRSAPQAVPKDLVDKPCLDGGEVSEMRRALKSPSSPTTHAGATHRTYLRPRNGSVIGITDAVGRNRLGLRRDIEQRRLWRPADNPLLAAQRDDDNAGVKGSTR